MTTLQGDCRETLKVLDLFSGIGGFSLGLERAGMQTIAFCEIEPYCRAVLRKHWPNVPIFEDVRTLTSADVPGVDVICGGFPCQDLSTAGRQEGISGSRSGLWSEMARLVSEIRPRYLIVENVTNLLAGESGQWFGVVLNDLAAVGYDAEWHCIPASYVGAPHIRDRVWVIAAPNIQENGIGSFGEIFARCAMSRRDSSREWGKTVPSISRMGDGIPGELDRLAALGNAVVPKIPEIIGRAIIEADMQARRTAQMGLIL
jgi:DNA (cytosine-5)-methyltransferase 1